MSYADDDEPLTADELAHIQAEELRMVARLLDRDPGRNAERAERARMAALRIDPPLGHA